MNPNLENAVTAHRGGHLAEARLLYQAVLSRRPKDADALNFLGILEFQVGERRRGIELLRKSLAAAPCNPHAWINLGNMLAAEQGTAEAIAAYQRAIAIDRTRPEAWYNLGVCQRRLRQLDAASMSLRRAIDARPDYGVAYEALGILLYQSDRMDEAADVYRRWLTVDPDHPVARHMATATSGEPEPARADDHFVATLFDRAAASFDERLAALGYRAPQLVAELLVLHPGYQSARLDILDAGCGTGLCGALLRSSARRLTGVDLSEGMLAKARDRRIYDELVAVELTSYLAGQRQAFDVVISADTLCYFGDLDPVARAAARALKPAGLLVFTVEALDGEEQGPYRLQPHGRYGHADGYLRDVVETASLAVLALDRVVLRKERGADVHGWLVAARASATTFPGRANITTA
jgi:predicted TPR repeat methyltransferase